MMHKRNTLTTIMAALLLTISGQAIADYDYYQETDGSLFPCSWCINNSFIRGDLLYLRAFEDGLSNPFEPSSSQVFHNDSESQTLTVSTGHGKEPKFRWDLGYRIGAGIDFVECNWDIAANWTHFSPNKTKHKPNRPRWKLDYDTVDVVIGYKCQINRCFIIDAFGGLRAARINQHIRQNFLSTVSESSISSSDSSSSSSSSYDISSPPITFTRSDKKSKQDFEGIGFIFGLKGEMQFDGGFTFFLEGDAGTLVGRNKLHFQYAGIVGSSTGFALTYKRHQEACQYFVDSNIGIRWQTCLCDSLKLVLELAYETHNYFNHNRVNTEGNLYINGGSFSAALQF
jgi:hypothetical protein